MNRTLPLLPVMLLLLLHAFVPEADAEPAAREIMERQQDRHALENEESTIVVLLVDAKGNQQKRTLKRWSKELEDGLYRTLIVFREPEDIAGTALLTWQLEGGGNKQWLHLPGQETLRRIAGQGRKSYFMGTDFTFEDLQPDAMEDYRYVLKGSEEVDGEPCHVIEITPASREKERGSAYGRRVAWIRKDILYPLKVEFYDRRGRLIKTQTNHELTPLTGEAWAARKALMTHHQTGHKTLMGLKSCVTDRPVEDDLFTERFLLTGKHLQ